MSTSHNENVNLSDTGGADWFTVDKLLGGRLTLKQPTSGYRFAIDPVLMTACVKVRAGEQVLDLGSGVGTASFCLLRRVPEVQVTGLELQSDLVALAKINATDNALGHSVHFIEGDLRDRKTFAPKCFDHVMANPPHFAFGSHTPPGHAGKATAHIEEATLQDWVRSACRWLKHRGRFSMIHRADRMHEVVSAMNGCCGDITVLPFWPRAGRPARRVLIQGMKGSKGPARVLPGLTLHDEVDKYTPAARAVLEQGEMIDLDL